MRPREQQPPARHWINFAYNIPCALFFVLFFLLKAFLCQFWRRSAEFDIQITGDWSGLGSSYYEKRRSRGSSRLHCRLPKGTGCVPVAPIIKHYRKLTSRRVGAAAVPDQVLPSERCARLLF